MDNFNKFYTMAPMKYYQPDNYKNEKAQRMLSNYNNSYIATQKMMENGVVPLLTIMVK